MATKKDLAYRIKALRQQIDTNQKALRALPGILDRLDRKVSRVQRTIAQFRFPECQVEWENQVLVVRAENLREYPTQLLKRFEKYLKMQEITSVWPDRAWTLITVE